MIDAVPLTEVPGSSRVLGLVQELFGELFGFSAERVVPHATFLELGADSLFLLRASQAIQQRLGVRVPFRRLLEELGTPEALAAYLERQMEDEPLAMAKLTEAPPAAAPAAPEVPPSLSHDAPAGEGRQAPIPPRADLAFILAEQLRLMGQQLEILNRSRQGHQATLAPPRLVRPPERDAAAAAATRPVPARRPVYVAHQPIDRSAGSELTSRQRHHVDRLVERLCRRTQRSKELTQAYRHVLANNRATAGFRRLWKELVYPLHGHRGAGARIWDVDGNEYIDLTMGFGSLLFGHSPEFLQRALREQLELGVQIGPESETAGRVAELVCELTGAERATFCNSGTEAVMIALRLARTVTGRSRIAIFAGSFHGTFDGVLAKGARGADGRLRPVALAPGIPQHLIDSVLMLDYESPESLDEVAAHAGELAAVLVEPRQSRRPEIETEGFLRRLREITEKSATALIFDEVVTGFRMHPGGVQALYGVRADLTTYGKAVANGMPIGVVAGKAVYLDAVDGGPWSYGDGSMPEAETTFVAGTFFRHPLVMAGALAVLREIREQGPELQRELGRRTGSLAAAINRFCEGEGLPVRVVHFGSLFTFTFPPEWTFMDLFFYHLLEKGIYVWERRICYLSPAHSEADLERVMAAVRESLGELRQGGFLPGRSAEMPAAAASAAGPVARTLPLTDAQRELWALAQFGEGASIAYNLSTSLTLRGPLRLPALRGALARVTNRHEALRITVDPLGEEQHVAPAITVDLPVDDLSGLSGREREQKLAQLLATEARHPFDLARGPLLRARLVRLGAELHVFALSVHHIVADGYSLGLILDEIGKLYAAEVSGAAVRLPAPVSFGDYVERSRARQADSAAGGSGAYWRERFAGPLPVLDLPTDRPRPPLPTYAGGRHVLTVDPALASGLRQLARRLGATSFMLLLAAVKVLLHRLTGEEDLVVGIPAAGQPLMGDYLVGYCINVLPLRTRLGGDPTFAAGVNAVKHTLLDAYEHQDYPFSRLLRDLGFSRDPGRPPLVSTLFNLDHVSELAIPGLEVEIAPNPTHSAQFDLEWNVTESDRGWTVECLWSADLFEAATIERWQEYLHNLMTAAVAGPENRIGDLEILGEPERQRLLVEWNRTESLLPRDRLFPDLFAEQARSAPAAPAAACDHGEWSYGELDRRSRSLARLLVQRGIGPGAVVALLAERGLAFLETVLAILRAGGAYLPLDPGHPAARWRQVLEQSGARWALADGALSAGLHRAAGGLIEVLALDELARERPAADVPLPCPSPDDLAYVMYTSGSTGVPKGAMITHRGMLNHLLAKVSDLELGASDTVAQTASQCFDISVWQLLAPLLSGGRVRIYGDDLLEVPAELLGRLEADAVSVFETVPSLLGALLAELERRRDRQRLAVLRWLLLTGEVLPPDLCSRWLALHPRVPILNAYGPTECSDDVTHHPVRRPPAIAAPRVPIGRPIANTRLYVLDPALRPVPTGVRGELCAGGLGVGRGYLHEPARTAEAFVPDPFSSAPGGRLYRTGDLARRLPGGEIQFLGRLDHQVKVHGFRLEPGEVEAALGHHPGVRQSAVIAREEGPGNPRLVAYVVPADGGAPGVDELRDHLARYLPRPMVPGTFVFLSALPLTPNGKLDRRALPAPDPGAAETGKPFVPPLTPVEKELAAIWQRLLGIARAGIHDDFFELGGDSILGIQVIARAREAGIRLSARQIFEHSTIAGLAAVAGTLPAAQADQGPVTGPVPLTPIQHWFFERDFPDPRHWNMSMLQEVPAGLDPRALDAAVGYCLAHHDALRLRYERAVDGSWRQRHAAPGGTPPFSHIDLASLPDSGRREAVESACAPLQASLDLAGGPLLRAAHFDFGKETPGRLFLTVHHLAIDVVSWQVLLADLAASYAGAASVEAPALPPKTTSFSAWARRLDEYAQSEELHRELGFWAAEPPHRAPRLPVDHPEGSNSELSARVVQSSLEPEETRALLHDVPRTYRAQASEALLAALAQSFGEWTGEPRLLIDLEGHGRESLFEDVDLSRTVGWFTALYPVLLDLSAAAEPGAALAHVKEQVRAVPRGGVGYGLLRYLSRREGVAAQLRALPQAQVSFNYEGRLEGSRRGGLLLGAAREGRGRSRGPRGERSHVLEIDGYVADGRLQMHWQFSESLHHRTTIERLAGGFTEALRRLLAGPAATGVAAYTPSDFPRARVDQAELHRFVQKLERQGARKAG